MTEWLVNLGQSVGWELAGETEVLRENLPPCLFVHHRCQMTWHGIELGLLWWDDGNYPCELWHGLYYVAAELYEMLLTVRTVRLVPQNVSVSLSVCTYKLLTFQWILWSEGNADIVLTRLLESISVSINRGVCVPEKLSKHECFCT
jgi:hypothetical protein